jgi:hypothetical protein
MLSSSKMEQELSCSICQSLFFDPVKLLDCQHIYCGSCIKIWLANPSAACPHCRVVPRAATSDRTINNFVEAYLVDNPQKVLSDTAKASRRQEYQPRTDISPSVPFIADARQPPIPRTPLLDPPRVATPESDENIPDIPRTPVAVGHIAPRIRTPLRVEPDEEIVPVRPGITGRELLPSLDSPFYGQLAIRHPAGGSNSPTYGAPCGAPQFANSINNYTYYQCKHQFHLC